MTGPAGFAATEAARHGGRLSAAMRAYPDAPRPWLDLSTGINPFAWAGPVAPIEALARLPDPEDVRRLEAVAATAFGAKAERVSAMAGSEAAIRLLPWLIGARSVDVVGPTYTSHAEAWASAGASPGLIAPADAAASRAEALVIVNPNNPDGHVWTPSALAALARDRWLVVDEAFVETAPHLSVAHLELERLIVLRSFGKFYGLAGVRLGFVLAAPAVTARIRSLRGDWPVCANALTLGAAAYADEAWRSAMIGRLEGEAARLDGLLAQAGLTAAGGTSLFRLVRAREAAALFNGLCRQGVLIRPFAARPGHLRFGLPPEGAEARLRTALEAAA